MTDNTAIACQPSIAFDPLPTNTTVEFYGTSATRTVRDVFTESRGPPIGERSNVLPKL